MYESRWANAISKFDPSSCIQDGEIEVIKRKRGRPRIRWEDDLNSFAHFHGFNDWKYFGHHFCGVWHNFIADFVNYVLNDECYFC